VRAPLARQIYLRFLVPGVLVWIALTFRRGARKNLHRTTFAAALATLGAGNLLFLYLTPASVHIYQPGALMLTVMLFYAALRLPFLWASAAGWLASAAFLIPAARPGVFPADGLSLSVLLVLSANALGMYVAYSTERSLRRDFLRRREIAAERARSEALLLNVLPAAVAERLKSGETTIADGFADVSILFADLAGYTEISDRLAAPELVSLLNDVFSRFDALMERHGAEKIKTIGDAYLAVCGLAGAPDHADAAAALALDMLSALDAVNRERGLSLSLRVGISSGPVVAGVIGSRKFTYDLWGDAVNVASRMESHGEPGRVQLSAAAASRLTRHAARERGVVDIKGKGAMTTYFLSGPAAS
jgi:class 3 adenylate cyclase